MSNAKPSAVEKSVPGSVTLFDQRTGKEVSKPVTDLFRRKKTFSAEVTSIKRQPEMIVMLGSEMYDITMPAISKDSGPSTATAIDVVDVVTGAESVLILHTVMRSALERARGTCTCVPDTDGGETRHHSTCTLRQLEGRYFAFRGGEIKAGKHYRQVDVVELERVG